MTPVNPYEFRTPAWYQWIHEEAQPLHDIFLSWVTPRLPQIESIAEIGRGKFGYYHRRFADKVYVGIDNEAPVIDYCRTLPALPNHAWLCRPVEGSPAETPFDLVFSRAVLDHAVDVDRHLRACLNLSRRRVYLMTYRVFFGDLAAHRQEQGADGYWYDDVSVPQLERLLRAAGVQSHVLQRVPTGRPAGEIQEELHVIVEK